MTFIGEATVEDYNRLLDLFGEDKVFILNNNLINKVKNELSLSNTKPNNIVVGVNLDYSLIEVLTNVNFKELTRHDWLLEN